ncbi:MAG: thiamine-phosphate kinase [Sedimenticola sp.]|nr:thiamine-phosphate kinase [Sedimenticola sp.]
MPSSEFQLIEHHFSRLGATREDVLLGVGDDCALLQVPPGKVLAVSLDTLVEGVHFLPGVDPEALGHKALAVNLSDLAAMGAEPAWATLALTLPRIDEAWIEAFCRGFAQLANRYRVQLVGGDTTRGPRAISVQVHGFVEAGQALRRDGAGIGDLVYVSGTLGDAGLALRAAAGEYDPGPHLIDIQLRLDRPQPRVEQALALRHLASAAIDLSDGLLADLGHICQRSGCGARLELPSIPLSPALDQFIRERGDWGVPLASGDDYELCLVVPRDRQAEFERVAAGLETPLRRVGEIEAEPGIRCFDAAGNPLRVGRGGYDHFGQA